MIQRPRCWRSTSFIGSCAAAGQRDLYSDFFFDSAGKLRLILRTPNWDDFVHLAFAEIRFYGASNVQIARRLRAMIINLANTLPGERHAALRQELDLLDRMLDKLYVLPEDLALARIPDSQGLGGSTRIKSPNWAIEVPPLGGAGAECVFVVGAAGPGWVTSLLPVRFL